MNGEDVTDYLHTPIISDYSSRVSAIPKVRDHVLELQRSIARSQNVVMEGRDITSHVLPKSKYKFFITASAEVRAQRRFEEEVNKGIKTSYEEVLEDIKQFGFNMTSFNNNHALDFSYAGLEKTLEAVESCAELAKAADFFSIGTNDLYHELSGAGGRDKEIVEDQSVRETVADMIEKTLKTAHEKGREVTVCGRMAENSMMAERFAGMGVDAVSLPLALIKEKA